MKKTLLISCVLALFVVLGVSGYRSMPEGEKQDAASVSTLDRVEKTGEIRCGYWIYDPYLRKDPNTGKMSGITVDYLERTAARLGKTIKWDTEIGFDQLSTALETGRLDTFCVPASPILDYEKVFDFVGSFGKLPYYIYVGKNSTFTSKDDLTTARFSAIEGYIATFETTHYFPQAKLLSLPMTASPADLYEQIKFSKVDAVLNEHISALNYMRNNADVIRRLNDTPLFTKDLSFIVKNGDKPWSAFMQKMTDTTTPENRELFLELVRKYDLPQDALIP